MSFLAELARTRSVTDAAASAGMSREGAHRLRARGESALFALLWDRALEAGAQAPTESHIGEMSDGRLACILGFNFLRKTAHPEPVRNPPADSGSAHRA